MGLLFLIKSPPCSWPWVAGTEWEGMDRNRMPKGWVDFKTWPTFYDDINTIPLLAINAYAELEKGIKLFPLCGSSADLHPQSNKLTPKVGFLVQTGRGHFPVPKKR